MVYVDALMDHGEGGVPPHWPYRYSCHMLADSMEELHTTAKKIGLNTKWFQDSPPASIRHYDLTQSMRIRAIGAGALDCSSKYPENRAHFEDCLLWERLRTKKLIKGRKK